MNTNERLRAVEQKIAALTTLREDLQRRLKETTEEIQTLSKDLELNQQAEYLLQHLSTQTLTQSVKTIDQLVTTGLRLVFDDLNLEFKTELDRSRGKTSVKFKLLEDGREAPILSSYGGGPLVLCGVLLRVVTIITLHFNRILLLDESLSHISAEYQANTSAFLKKICQELEFTIIMVTHAPAFAEHADHHYEAKRRQGGGTVFEETKP